MGNKIETDDKQIVAVVNETMEKAIIEKQHKRQTPPFDDWLGTSVRQLVDTSLQTDRDKIVRGIGATIEPADIYIKKMEVSGEELTTLNEGQYSSMEQQSASQYLGRSGDRYGAIFDMNSLLHHKDFYRFFDVGTLTKLHEQAQA